MVEVEYRSGIKETGKADAWNLSWLDDGASIDITRYRILTPRVTFEQIREMVKQADPNLLQASDFNNKHAPEANAFVVKLTDLINAHLAQGGVG